MEAIFLFMIGVMSGSFLTIFFAVMVNKVKLTREQEDLLDRWERLNDRCAELEKSLRRRE